MGIIDQFSITARTGFL